MQFCYNFFYLLFYFYCCQLTNVTDIIKKHDTFVEKFPTLGAYAIVLRGNDAFWNGGARKHYESLSKEFSGTLFVRKFLVSFEMTLCFFVMWFFLWKRVIFLSSNIRMFCSV